MIGPLNQTEDIIPSITKKCEMLIQETHIKSQETKEFNLIKPRITFHFIPPSSIEGSWMLG